MAQALLKSASSDVPTPSAPLPLRQRAIRGTFWALGGHGARQAIRLGSSLILTRLLFPEAFGLMALVQVFLQGLQMFSDLGIQPSIIHNPRGHEPRFLNTAWTIQVIRGLVLWSAACLLAWPVAVLYEQPLLTALLPVVGLSTIASGFRSTKLAIANREVMLGRLTCLEIGCQLLSVAVMVPIAWYFQSVWALVAGSVLSSIVEAVLSHRVLQGHANRFCWDREALRELWHFGRWIFLSTILAYLASQGDRLILGSILDMRYLGIYGIAVVLSRAVVQAAAQMASRVLFPSYAELVRERPERLYATLRKSRLLMLAMTWSTSLLLIAFGDQLVNLLYDDRYREAGWMLRVVSLGTLVHILGQSYSGVLLARGLSRPMAMILGFTALVQLVAMLVGSYLGGRYGLVLGIAATSWIAYPLEAYYHRQIGLWQPEVDLPLYAAATALAGLMLYVGF